MKKVASLLVLALVAAALVACGGDDDDGTTTTTETGAAAEGGTTAGGGGEEGGAAGGETLEFEADPGGELAYTTDSASTGAGQVEVEFTNPQTVPHDVAIEAEGGEQVGKTDIVTDGSASTTVKLKAGEYTFYCSVPGHREAGMEGTLTAK